MFLSKTAAERLCIYIVVLKFVSLPLQAIIDAEANASSGRRTRVAVFGSFGGLAGALTLTRIAMNLSGNPVPSDFLQPSATGEVLDLIVVVAAALLWSQEVTTREENIQRIWAEVKKRSASEPKEISADFVRETKRGIRKRRRRSQVKGFQRGIAARNLLECTAY
uniref:Uncharacterized protein n=1 Tax=Tetraselmis sp. GSL018 TaxID=582737 RepID=A0A061RHM7_9CHLO